MSHPAPASAKPDITYETFSEIELRTADVIGAEYFRGKPNLILLSVDLGYEQTQMIVGKGLPDLYEPADIIGRQVIWMANLKPKKIMGGMSKGMIVAVGDNRVDGLVVPERRADPGARVQ
ncbi:hypothetical protein E1264_09480 [Actinomadura sp. KC216]|uniref:hypothetical protein n=1 Tax=Actinomadura sp. KC216 TaxID=2530370 RepID=UPI00104D7166|nr:hypothetical protein [Actinomadura sp. KC216]TDB89007.1 hypothetical protein E1264_09480 [Actinomadura sp. KC216]